MSTKIISRTLVKDRSCLYNPWQSWVRWAILGLCLLLLGGCQPSTDPRGPLQLTLWHAINPPPNRDVFEQLVDQFNQTHPQVQVQALYVGQADQLMPKILTAVIGNAPPDILWFDSLITGRLVELQAIQPLETWLNHSPLKAEIDPVLFESMELEDHLWSIPFTTNNAGIFYRPSLFQAAGITQLPQTWEDLRVAAAQLTQDKNGDGRIDQYGLVLPLGKGEWTVFSWLPFMFSAGGELVAANQPTLVNPGAIAALEFWSKLLQEGSAINSLPERGYEQDGFIAGRVAMQITGPWTLSYLGPTGVDFAVLPFPVAQQPAAVLGGASLFVMKTTPEREQAARQFLEYTLSEQFQTTLAVGTGSLPVNLKSRESQAYREFVAQQPALEVFLDQMAWARSRPIIPQYHQLSESLGRAIEATLLGVPPEKALSEAQHRLELIWPPPS